MDAKSRRKWTTIKQYIPLYLMVIPGAIYIIINNYIPMVGLQIAFKQYDYSQGITGGKFVGLNNFKFLFVTKDAWIITRNTLCYNAVFIVLGTVMAIFVAVLLSEIVNINLKKTYQTIILIPYLISIVIVSYLVYAFLNADTGFINNRLLAPLGIAPVSWYSKVSAWPVILVLVQIWKSFGYTSILYYATLIGVDRSYYEAAAIDGASRWQQIKNISLPSLKPTIVILTLMSIGRIFYSDFGLFYQVPMNSGLLLDVTNTIDTYVYRGLTTNNIGMASAAGFYQSIVGFVLVLMANCIVTKIDKDNALF